MIEMTLEMAEKAVKAAQAKARDLGATVTVSVVDEAGHLVLAARGDGMNFLTPETSRAKAVAAVAFRCTTKQIEEQYNKSPVFWGNVTALLGEQVLTSVGGVPLTYQGRIIGGIACGGATGEQDHMCAEAGAAVLEE